MLFHILFNTILMFSLFENVSAQKIPEKKAMIQTIASFSENHRRMQKELAVQHQISEASIPTVASTLFVWSIIEDGAIKKQISDFVSNVVLNSKAVQPEGLRLTKFDWKKVDITNRAVDLLRVKSPSRITSGLQNYRIYHQIVGSPGLAYLDLITLVEPSGQVTILYADATKIRMWGDALLPKFDEKFNGLLIRKHIEAKSHDYLNEIETFKGDLFQLLKNGKTYEDYFSAAKQGSYYRNVSNYIENLGFPQRLQAFMEMIALNAHQNKSKMSDYTPLFLELFAANASFNSGTKIQVIGKSLPLIITTGIVIGALWFLGQKQLQDNVYLETLTELNRTCHENAEVGCEARFLASSKLISHSILIKMNDAVQKIGRLTF